MNWKCSSSPIVTSSRSAIRNQTVAEEIVNSITCLVGLCLSIAALVVLVTAAARQADVYKIVSASIFGVSLILMYLSSMMYHALPPGGGKHVFEIMDHSTVYSLIAGTYTPFTLVTLRGPWGWSLFGVVWGLTLFGVVFKSMYIKRFRLFSNIVYLGMGWIVVIALQPLLQRLPMEAVLWLLAGGLFYSVGIIFYAWKNLLFGHALWHLFVMAGSFCHFLCVLKFVIPQ